MARLDVMDGVDVVKSFVIEDEVVIGRLPTKRQQSHFLDLSDHRISREHVRIKRVGWTFLLEDLGSVNGTILRGETIPAKMPHDLYDGDDIWLASAHLIFYAEEDKLTLYHPPEPVDLPAPSEAEPRAIPVEASRRLPVVRHMADTIPVQLSTILNASMALRLSSMIAAHDQAIDQDVRRQLRAMCQVSATLGTLQNRDKLMQNLVDVILEIFPLLDRVCILLCRGNGLTLIPAAAKERHASDAVRDVAIAQAVLKEVLTKKHAVRSLDMFGHVTVQTQDETADAPQRGVMCVPLLVDDEEVLGLIHADTTTHPQALTDHDLEILTGIGTQAAIALKNAQLYDAVQPDTTPQTNRPYAFSTQLTDLLTSGALHDALAGHRDRGTILWSNMIRLPARSATMPPTQVVSHLQQSVAVMQRIIHKRGGNMDRCAGDGLMAFWGVFQPSPEDENEAVRAALYMQARLWPLNVQLEAEGQQPLAMGVGLHTGELTAGNIGTPDALTLTVLGESVTIAAQLAHLATHAQVFVAATTWQPIRHLVSAIQLPPLTLSGQTSPLTLYAIRSIRRRTHRACLLALPCALHSRQGDFLGQGMITESTLPRKVLRLFLSTPHLLQLGETLMLHPMVPEYHEPLPCLVRVDSCVRQADKGSQHVYTKAVLTVLEGGDFPKLVTPGNCLTTSHSWETLGQG